MASPQAIDILRTDYNPSDLDILYAEGVTSSNGLAHFEFTFPQSAHDDNTNTDYDQHDCLLRYVAYSPLNYKMSHITDIW